MTKPVRRHGIKLSRASTMLLHLAATGHVWRDDKGFWVASTPNSKRNVHLRISTMIGRGLLEATYKDQFPRATRLGQEYLRDHPVDDALEREIR